jgi:photosystem II stability/assembly factor-like uncharacterized protein
MKSLCAFFVALVFLFSTATSQTNWFWLNPQPQGNNLLATHFVNNTTGFAVGEFGTVLKTINEGQTWTQLTAGTSRTLRAVYFVDASTGFVAGDSGTILKTTNGGTSWITLTSGTLNTLRTIFFRDANTGTVAGNSGTIIKTADGGTTWNPQTSGTTRRLVGISYPSADTGYIVGYSQGGQGGTAVMRTTNGGTNWSTVDSVSNNFYTGVSFIDANNGFVCANSNRIIQTTDAGATWFRDSVAGNWNGISYISPNTVYATGSNGALAKSADNGVSWSALTSGTFSSFFGISFTSPTTGTVVGTAGIILRTTSGGDSWSNQISSVTTQELFAVDFYNRNIGVAAGRSATLLRTTNAGKNWTSQVSGGIGIFRGLYVLNANTYIAVSDSGSIVRTTNAGESWNVQQLGASQPLYAVYFSDNQNGFLVGANGLIMKSTDSGETWTALTSGITTALVGTYFLNEMYGVAVGSGGIILKTSDAGATWSSQTSGSNQILRSAFFSDTSNGIIVGSGGVILRTSNGGTNWSVVASGTTNQLRGVAFTDANTGTIAGYSGTILATTDGGATWASQVSSTSNNLNAVSFTDANTGTVVGANGTILRRQINIEPPAAPALISPSNAAVNQPISLTLSWNETATAESYNVQVASDSMFHTLIADEATTAVSFEVSLMGSTKYFWRVNAENLGGEGEYSAVWSFTTEFVTPPDAPVLVSPANDTTNLPATVHFFWNAIANVIHYQLIIASDSMFATAVVSDSNITSDEYEVSLGSFTKYFWKVRAMNAGGWGTFSSVWKFKTQFVGAPASPVLSSPANGAAGQSLSLMLQWNSSSGANSYRLQFGTDSSFATTMVDDSTLEGNAFEVHALTISTTYYWRVNAKNVGGTSAYSATWNFMTKYVAPPATPTLATPENGAVNQPTTIVLHWNAVDTVEHYQVQLSNDSLFENLLVNDSLLTGTSRTVQQLQTLTMYYWRVRAKNVGGTSDYSSLWNFTTVTAPPSTPQSVYPQNNSTGIPVAFTFLWRKTDRAETYQMQLATDQLFTNIILEDSTLADTMKEVSGLTVNTQYFWHVRARNIGGVSNYNNARRFTTVTPPPPAPTLLTPSDDSTNVPIPYTFRWVSVGGGFVFYRLQIALDSSFAEIVFEDSMIFNPVRQVTILEHNTMYYWRVNARTTASGTGEFSSIWSFTTIIAPPSAPVLVGPPNGGNNVPVIPLFRWHPVENAGMYHLQLATDSMFTSIIGEDSTIIDTMQFIDTLEHNAMYYWRVRARNIGGRSDWSTQWSFRTIVARPQQVILVMPENGQNIRKDSVMFVWNKSYPEVERYAIVIARDSLFQNIFFADTLITDTTKVVHAFTTNQTYWWRARAYNAAGGGLPSAVWKFRVSFTDVNERDGVPTEFALEQNFPNPLNPATTIAFSIKEESNVSLIVYDALGREVIALINSEQKVAGKYNITFDATNLPSGIYIYKLTAGSFVDVKKMVLMK